VSEPIWPEPIWPGGGRRASQIVGSRHLGYRKESPWRQERNDGRAVRRRGRRRGHGPDPACSRGSRVCSASTMCDTLTTRTSPCSGVTFPSGERFGRAVCPAPVAGTNASSPSRSSERERWRCSHMSARTTALLSGRDPRATARRHPSLSEPTVERCERAGRRVGAVEGQHLPAFRRTRAGSAASLRKNGSDPVAR
jgi:hypothetical protein